MYPAPPSSAFCPWAWKKEAIFFDFFDKLAFSEGAHDPKSGFELEGKPYQTTVQGRHVITYVYDHPVKMVHILAIE